MLQPWKGCLLILQCWVQIHGTSKFPAFIHQLSLASNLWQNFVLCTLQEHISCEWIEMKVSCTNKTSSSLPLHSVWHRLVSVCHSISVWTLSFAIGPNLNNIRKIKQHFPEASNLTQWLCDSSNFNSSAALVIQLKNCTFIQFICWKKSCIKMYSC